MFKSNQIFNEMKKLTTKIFLLTFIIIGCISGCKKAEDPPTTYQIINNCTPNVDISDSYLDGSMWEVVVFSYLGTDIVNQDNIARVAPSGGKSEIIEVNSTYEKVRVSFKFLPPQSANYNISANVRQYVVATKILEKGKNNVITVQDNTQISSTAVNNGEDKPMLIMDAKNILRSSDFFRIVE